MTGQLLVMALAGLGLGVCAGYPCGRWNGNRALDRAADEGYDEGRADGHRDGWNDGLDEAIRQIEQRAGMMPGEALLGVAVDALDWRERTAVELAPETLAQENVPEPAPDSSGHSQDLGSYAAASAGLATGSGLGHPSPYTGPLTPAQRRRDKHKQRGPWAPGEFWGEDDTARVTRLVPVDESEDDWHDPTCGQPGDLPDPPTDVGAWWQAELDALLVCGQSDWLTRNLEAVAA